MSEKLRKLKDEAAQLVQKGKLEKALAVYEEVLAADSGDITARLKCGDILRKLNQSDKAIAQYISVAQVYAADGLLLKAIAACKLILEMDPQHTDTQKIIADLYAKKSGRSSQPPSLPAGFTPPPPKASAPAATPPPLKQKPAAAEIEELDDDDIVMIEEAEPAVKELPTIPLFSELPKNAFIALLERMEMRNAVPDEFIIRQGDVDDSMFIVSSGRVKITKTGDQGKEVVLAHLTDGAFFGEMALLSESPRTASVIAEEETLLFQVSRETLSSVVDSYPSVKHALLRFYRQRLLSNLMATSPIFRPLDANQRRTLIEQFKSREVGANEKLLEEGEKGDGLYLLLSGRAEVSKKVDGKRQVLAHLKEGDVFGEMSLLTNNPVSANIKTLKKSIVLKLPRRVFSEIASTHPQLLAHIAELSDERSKTTQAIMKGQLKFSEDEGLVLM
ncbi:MAG: cyclic nucleotide-binding domain-containing protein [Myxococcota bacterium]